MSKTNWKPQDFEGSGHYVVRAKNEHIQNTGFLMTIAYKISYTNQPQRMYGLTSMADGWARYGDIKDSKFIPFTSMQDLCDSMNNANPGQRYRPATKEEILRIINYANKHYAD